jgi:hypothetical protein
MGWSGAALNIKNAEFQSGVSERFWNLRDAVVMCSNVHKSLIKK